MQREAVTHVLQPVTHDEVGRVLVVLATLMDQSPMISHEWGLHEKQRAWQAGLRYLTEVSGVPSAKYRRKQGTIPPSVWAGYFNEPVTHVLHVDPVTHVLHVDPVTHVLERVTHDADVTQVSEAVTHAASATTFDLSAAIAAEDSRAATVTKNAAAKLADPEIVPPAVLSSASVDLDDLPDDLNSIGAGTVFVPEDELDGDELDGALNDLAASGSLKAPKDAKHVSAIIPQEVRALMSDGTTVDELHAQYNTVKMKHLLRAIKASQ